MAEAEKDHDSPGDLGSSYYCSDPSDTGFHFQRKTSGNYLSLCRYDNLSLKKLMRVLPGWRKIRLFMKG